MKGSRIGCLCQGFVAGFKVPVVEVVLTGDEFSPSVEPSSNAEEFSLFLVFLQYLLEFLAYILSFFS